MIGDVGFESIYWLNTVADVGESSETIEEDENMGISVSSGHD